MVKFINLKNQNDKKIGSHNYLSYNDDFHFVLSTMKEQHGAYMLLLFSSCLYLLVSHFPPSI